MITRQDAIRSGAQTERRSMHAGMAVIATLVSVLLSACDVNAPFMMAQSGSQPGSPDYIDEAVAEIKARLPERVDNYTQLSDVRATPNGFEYTLRLIHSPTATVTHDWLERTKLLLASQSCDDRRVRAELAAGLNSHYVVRGKDDRIAGRFFISEAICRKALSPAQQSQTSLTLPTIE